MPISAYKHSRFISGKGFSDIRISGPSIQGGHSVGVASPSARLDSVSVYFDRKELRAKQVRPSLRRTGTFAAASTARDARPHKKYTAAAFRSGGVYGAPSSAPERRIRHGAIRGRLYQGLQVSPDLSSSVTELDCTPCPASLSTLEMSSPRSHICKPMLPASGRTFKPSSRKSINFIFTSMKRCRSPTKLANGPKCC